jgi:hypothetical protein
VIGRRRADRLSGLELHAAGYVGNASLQSAVSTLSVSGVNASREVEVLTGVSGVNPDRDAAQHAGVST